MARCTAPHFRQACLILAVGLLLLYLSARSGAEPASSDAHGGDAFYLQLLPSTSRDAKLIGSVPRSYIVEETADGQLRLVYQLDDANFNAQWMAQQNGSTKVRHGTAALGRFLRMSLRSWYGDRIADSVRVETEADDSETVTSNGDSMEYKLRVRDDELSVGMEYKF